MEQNVPLVRRFSELEPYQEAYTLVCSLEPTGAGCWLSVSRTMARDGSAESLEKRCERIYRSWGLNTSDANKRYLTGAVRVMMASDHRLAIRKEILGAVAQEHHLTIAAVDSALRRLLDTLDATGTQAWLDFRKEYGLERKRVTIGRLIYALESKLSQQEG